MKNYELINTLQNIAKHLARLNPEIQLEVVDENTIIFKGIKITPNQLIVMLENGVENRKTKELSI